MFYFCTHLPSIDIYAQTSTLYHLQDRQTTEASLRWKTVLSNVKLELQQKQSIKSCMFCVLSPALSGAWRFFLTVTVFLVSFPQACDCQQLSYWQQPTAHQTPSKREPSPLWHGATYLETGNVSQGVENISFYISYFFYYLDFVFVASLPQYVINVPLFFFPHLTWY